MKPLLQSLLLVAALTPSLGCEDTGDTEGPDGGVSVSVVSGSGQLTLRVGETVAFTVTTNLEEPYLLHWSSTDPERLSVDQTGAVRGLKIGSASVIVVLEFPNGREAFGRADLTVLP